MQINLLALKFENNLNRRRIFALLTLVSTLFGFMEWGGGNSTFVFSAEREVLRKIFENPISVFHPLIILPFVGQMILVISVIIPGINRWISISGIICAGLLFIMILLTGLFTLNVEVILSVMPFFIFSFMYLRSLNKPLHP
jgi:hypothetical protein